MMFQFAVPIAIMKKHFDRFVHVTPSNLTLQEAAPIILEIAESIATKAQQWQDEWEQKNSPCMFLDDLVEEQNGIDLSKWLEKPVPIDRSPNVNPFPAITKAEAIAFSMEEQTEAIELLEVDEDIEVWESEIFEYMKSANDQSRSLAHIVINTSLTPVQVWLALLLGQKLEMRRSDEDSDFWGMCGIRVHHHISPQYNSCS